MPNHLLVLLVVLSFARGISGQHVRRNRQTQEENAIHNNTLAQGIIGGSQAAEGEFPWFAAFVPMVSCGGALIAPDRVLTAAHCVQTLSPPSVRVGVTNTYDGEQIDVKCAMRHPDFTIDLKGNIFNDLAILKLASPSSATPVTLNSNVDYPSTPNASLTVIGFGKTAEDGEVSDVLKKLETHFQPIATCKNNYPDIEFGTHVCADVENEGDCQGDSGGPLLDSNNVQVGIVSYGIGCARPEQDIYAAVAKYHEWIQSQITSDECNVDAAEYGICWWFAICCERVVNFIMKGVFRMWY